MKRFVLIIALLALVVAACSGSGDADTSDAETETTAAETAAESEESVPDDSAPDDSAPESSSIESDPGDVAATVGGVEITVGDVEDLRDDQEADLSADEFSQLLSAVISWNVVSQGAAEEFDIEPSDADIDAEIDQIIEDFGQGAERDEFIAAQGISESILRESAIQFLVQRSLQEEIEATVDGPTDEDAEQALTGEPLQWTTVCAAHILVETEEEALAVVGRVEDGEDFAVVAEEVSVDTGSGAEGGELGCASPTGYVPEFAEATMTAEIGVIGDPVETEFGFHVIRVESRETSTPEEVRDQMTESLVAADLEQWYAGALDSADVVVVAKFGTWVTEPTPQVQPPS